MKGFKAITLAVIGAILAACGGGVPGNPGPTPPPPPGSTPAKSLSGTLFAPTGGDVRNTVLLACAVVDQNCDRQDPRTKELKVPDPAASYNFSLKVEAGDYVLLAYKDTNRNGKSDDGDYEGCYSLKGSPTCAVVRPSMQAIEVAMKTVGKNNDSSVSGKVFAVAGDNLYATHVFVCDPLKASCLTDYLHLGFQTQIPYTLKVPRGRYYVAAWRDLDLNDTVSELDHYGCYGQDAYDKCTLLDIEGALTGKDIYLYLKSTGQGIEPLGKGLLNAMNLAIERSRNVPFSR